MTCPDWKTLAAWREDTRGEEPAEWQEALAHFDRGCSRCRRAAVAADPTLVFRRLTHAVPEMAPAQEASEVEAMRRGVAAMRAASRVEAAERRGRSTWAASWKRWAAAAALTAAALSIPADDARLRREPSASRVAAGLTNAMPAVLSAGGAETLAVPAALVPAEIQDDLPILEGVNRPDARIYQMEGEGLAVVMVVDESLGV